MVSLASVQRLSDELPNITFAFASEVGYKVKSSLMRFSCPSMHMPARAFVSYGILQQDHMALHQSRLQGEIVTHALLLPFHAHACKSFYILWDSATGSHGPASVTATR